MTEIKFETNWKGGRGARTRAGELSAAIQEAARTLIYAAGPEAGGAEAPAHIYSHVANLYLGTDDIAVALERMADRIESLNQRGVMYHDSDGDVNTAAIKSIAALHEAARGARALSDLLRGAQNAISPLSMTREAAARVDAAYGDDD
jgi:hypothetical protein